MRTLFTWGRCSTMIMVLVAALLVSCRPAPPPTTAAPDPTRAATSPPATNTATEQPMPEMTEPAETEAAHEPETEEGSPILDPVSIPKFAEPLVIPPVMPSEGEKDWDGAGEIATEYWIAVRQFVQQILPSGYPSTTVWGYGRYGDPLPGSSAPTTFNSPAFTIEARSNERVRVVWVNQLVDDPASSSPQFLPSLLPIDTVLHWADPLGLGHEAREERGHVPYDGPIPIITHVHGAHVPSNSDGYPEAWYLPAASNIPENITMQGEFYNSVHEAPPGAAVFEYPNDQRAAMLWYHDHALGITRLNVYSGLAGFWILRDEVEDSLNLPGPAPRAGDAPDTRYYEIPLAIQDRTFREDGSLFYPTSREFFDGYTGPFMPETSVLPIWNPEFFGNTIMVNGRTWPYLEVEPRLYRLRFLNGSNSRFLILKFDQTLDFHQIGNEGGFLPNEPLTLDQLLMAPAERADVIVDFSQFAVGDEITLLNLGPDSPFGSLPVDPADQANPETTGQVMQFRIVELTDQGNPGSIPDSLPSIDALATTLPARDVTLNEVMSMPADIPVEAMLGTGADGALDWDEPMTETPMLGDTEIWRIINLTADAHPIHLHLVHFQVLDRTPFDKEAYRAAQAEYVEGDRSGEPPDPMDFATGEPVPLMPWEAGWKETVIASPDMITRIIANFDLAGLYLWHCHILEHEDNEMMRPYEVLAP